MLRYGILFDSETVSLNGGVRVVSFWKLYAHKVS